METKQSKKDTQATRSQQEWERLTQTVIAYTSAHGINMVSDSRLNTLIHAPVTLLPTVLDRSSYEHVIALSPAWNELVDRISRDIPFIVQHLTESAKADPWLARLLDMLKRLEADGKSETQPIRLGIYRSDYMINVEEAPSTHANDSATSSSSSSSPSPLASSAPLPLSTSSGLIHTAQQIELNTISASFAGLSTRVSKMHQFMLERELGWTEAEAKQKLPVNEAIQNIAAAFNTALQLYQQQSAGSNLVVVMVVQPGESNAVDQRILEYTLWSNHRIRVVRLTLADLIDRTKLNDRGEVVLESGEIAAIIYYRAGYTPRDYLSDKEYQAIEQMERSVAIKCPSLAVHLAGTKKIQQVLAQPSMVERFVSRHEDVQQLRSSFAGLYALEEDDESTKAVIDDAIRNPSSYVLKPQREGGGNNLWNNEMVDALKRMNKQERAAFILMKKISPRPAPAALLRKGEWTISECISELGIYSAFVGDGRTTHHTTFCGHLLRTKAVGVDEGGVAAGFSCISSVAFDH